MLQNPGPTPRLSKLIFALYRGVHDIGVVLGRARVTGQGAVSPAGIDNRRIASIFQGAMRAVSLIGRHLRQGLIAARIALGVQFVDQGVVKTILRQPRLVRKEGVYEFDQARLVLTFELSRGDKNLVCGKKGRSGVGLGHGNQTDAHGLTLRLGPVERGLGHESIPA